MRADVPALILSPSDRGEIERWLQAHGTPQQVALRGRIVLASAGGMNACAVARELGTNRKTVTLWRERFGSDPAIIGRTITLDGAGREIIGVMPADFVFPSTHTELWLPLHIDASRVSSYWAGDYMPIVARLRPGASIADASAESRILQEQVRPLFPWQMPADWNKDINAISLQ